MEKSYDGTIERIPTKCFPFIAIHFCFGFKKVCILAFAKRSSTRPKYPTLHSFLWLGNLIQNINYDSLN